MADNTVDNLIASCDPSVEGSPSSMLLELFAQFRREQNICIPAIVESVSEGYVTARPLVKSVYATEDGDKNVPRPAVIVPVMNFMHGGIIIHAPIYAGDTGWIIAGDRDWTPAVKGNSTIPSEDKNDNEGPADLSSFAVNKFDFGFFVPNSWAKIPDKLEDLSDQFFIGSVTDDDYKRAFMTIDKKSGSFLFHTQGLEIEFASSGITIKGKSRNVFINPDGHLGDTDAMFREINMITGIEKKSNSEVLFKARKVRVLADEGEYEDDIDIQVGGGEPGPPGPPGPSGTPAGFGTPTASATTLPAGSSATATVTAAGPDTAKIFSFVFGIPKGDKGDTPPLADEVPPADNNANGAVGTSTEAAREDHKHPWGPNYVRNNAGWTPTSCNILQAGTALHFNDGDGNTLRFVGTQDSPQHQIQYRQYSSGSTTNHNFVNILAQALEYGGSLPSSGKIALFGAYANTLPIVFEGTIYIGPTSSSNPKRTSIGRSLVDFIPISGAATGGGVNFHYNGGNLTGQIIDGTDGLEIRSYTGGSSQGHTNSIKITALPNKTKLANAPTITLADSPTDTDKNAIATVGWIGGNLHSLSVNGVDTGIKVIATADINIVTPTPGTATIYGPVKYDTTTHQLQQRVDTINLATGAITPGSYAMIDGGQAVEETV